ncbi:hypothetical protein CFR73_06485 [Novacetimonas maltaceti]|uniref:Uncharacterized protein n=1 Tax=Novacetimonas maltaceti TaxID=1203393 RepID=A0A2S3W2R2_9PROT|nr:hypothetical protein [Novacetimonas maltaceti]POF63150.1 hypothetical protein KMAL_12340 [Novacetimonas maltaceti]PYD60613.1 hypothetical protein CFR73_06485 [Novacetimonas maltaceti]
MIDNHDNFTHLLHSVVISTRDEVTLLRAAMDDTGLTSCIMISPPDAGCFMGVGWWRALVADAPAPAFLDCGMAAGRAAEGLRAGLAGVIVDPACTQHVALAELARVTGGRCLRARPDAHVIGGPDAALRLRGYLRRARPPHDA